jgi:DNA-binding MarR family transcriptional regulator
MAVARGTGKKNAEARDDARERLFDRYSQNLCRNIIALAEVVQRKLMVACRDEGFAGLKLSYGQVIPLIEPQGTRIIDVARSSGISKQAIGQIANDLEQQGYIVRGDDDADKRAKKLLLTARGIELIRAAGNALGSIERQAGAVLGDNQWQSMMRASETVFSGMRLSPPKAGQFVGGGSGKGLRQVNIATLFPALAAHIEQRLMSLLIERGFGELKRSFSQVLAYLPRDGIRINDLAELHGVSKQAVSQIVAAIEAQGFVRLIEDDADKRAKRILLTARGEDLLTDSVQAMTVVENEISDVLGTEIFAGWCGQVNQLYRAWCSSYGVTAAVNGVAPTFDLKTQVAGWLGALPAAERERYIEEGDGRLREDVIDALRQLRVSV